MPNIRRRTRIGNLFAITEDKEDRNPIGKCLIHKGYKYSEVFMDLLPICQLDKVAKLEMKHVLEDYYDYQEGKKYEYYTGKSLNKTHTLNEKAEECLEKMINVVIKWCKLIPVTSIPDKGLANPTPGGTSSKDDIKEFQEILLAIEDMESKRGYKLKRYTNKSRKFFPHTIFQDEN
jgi:hypothetical protein